VSKDLHSSTAPIPGVGMTFGDFAEEIIRATQLRINTVMPGIVLEWSGPRETTRGKLPATVKVQPAFDYARVIDFIEELLPNERLTTERGEQVAIGRRMPLPSVPVIYPGGMGCSIRGRLEVDEEGLLVFCQRNIGSWRHSGGIVEPKLARKFSITDAMFIPGARSGTRSPAVPTDGTWVIGPENDKAGLRFGPGEAPATELTTQGATLILDAATTVRAGGDSAESVARSLPLQLELIAACGLVTGTPDVVAGFASFAAQLANLDAAVKTAKFKGQ
jgi:hypothetical protein